MMMILLFTMALAVTVELPCGTADGSTEEALVETSETVTDRRLDAAPRSVMDAIMGREAQPEAFSRGRGKTITAAQLQSEVVDLELDAAKFRRWADEKNIDLRHPKATVVSDFLYFTRSLEYMQRELESEAKALRSNAEKLAEKAAQVSAAMDPPASVHANRSSAHAISPAELQSQIYDLDLDIDEFRDWAGETGMDLRNPPSTAVSEFVHYTTGAAYQRRQLARAAGEVEQQDRHFLAQLSDFRQRFGFRVPSADTAHAAAARALHAANTGGIDEAEHIFARQQLLH